MTYFILFPDDTVDVCKLDTNILGEDTGFGTFWTGTGFKAFSKIIDDQHDIINHITIMDDKGKKYEVDQFLNCLKGLRIRQ